jgi:hypothetical protein
MEQNEKKKIIEDLIGTELKTLPLQFGLITITKDEEKTMFSGVESTFHNSSSYIVTKLYKPISKMIKQSV